jgi:hypothetical protein
MTYGDTVPVFHKIFHEDVENSCNAGCRFGIVVATTRKPPLRGRLLNCSFRKKLSSHFFQQLLVNVEVGVNVLHVVMLFERFH